MTSQATAAPAHGAPTVEARVSFDQLMPKLRGVLLTVPTAVMMMGFSAGMAAGNGGRTFELFLGYAVGVVGAYGLAVGALLTRRVSVVDGTLVRRGLLTLTRRIAAGDVQGIFLTSMMLQGGVAPSVFFIGKENRCLLRLNRSAWRDDDIRAIGRALGVPVESSRRAGIDGGEIASVFPGSVSWVELHAGELSFAFVAVTAFAGVLVLLRILGTLHVH